MDLNAKPNLEANIGFCAGEMGPVEAGRLHGNALQTSKDIHVKEELSEDSLSVDGEYNEA